VPLALQVFEEAKRAAGLQVQSGGQLDNGGLESTSSLEEGGGVLDSGTATATAMGGRSAGRRHHHDRIE